MRSNFRADPDRTDRAGFAPETMVKASTTTGRVITHLADDRNAVRKRPCIPQDGMKVYGRETLP
jgi:hypothetical protein